MRTLYGRYNTENMNIYVKGVLNLITVSKTLLLPKEIKPLTYFKTL